MDKRYYEGVNETVYHSISNSGLNVYIIKKEGFASKSAYFATRFGSFNTGDIVLNNDKEVKVIGGLAHFLEHRVFDYKLGNVIDLYYKLGADVNAYTSYDRTVYYFNTIDNFNECLELLLDFPISFTMSEEKVENEKDIIVSELLMYQDDPNEKLFRGLMNAMYKEHPIRFDVGGEVEEVRATTRDLLESVHSTFYNPKNMVLVIVGDIDVEETINIINNKEFNNNNFNYKKNEINEDENVIEEKKVVFCEVNNEKMMIGYKLLPMDTLPKSSQTRVFLALDLLTSILFAPSSDFYKEMIDEQYVSSLFLDMLQYDNMFALLLEVDLLKNEEEVFEKINLRLKNAKDVITQDKLDSIKKKEISTIIKGSDSCSTLAKQYMTFLLDDMDYFEIIDLIKSIDINDLKDAYDAFYKNAKHSYCVLRSNND